MSQEEFNLAFLGGIFLPLMLFVISYTVSKVREAGENSKRRKNLQKVFFKELKANYDLLNPYVHAKQGATDDEYIQRIIPEATTDTPLLVADVCRGLSISVWDKYLDRLDLLLDKDVDKIYDAYAATIMVIKDAERVFDVYATGKQAPQYSLALLSRAAQALDSLKIALEIFEDDDSGKAIKVYGKFRDDLNKPEA